MTRAEAIGDSSSRNTAPLQHFSVASSPRYRATRSADSIRNRRRQSAHFRNERRPSKAGLDGRPLARHGGAAAGTGQANGAWPGGAAGHGGLQAWYQLGGVEPLSHHYGILRGSPFPWRSVLRPSPLHAGLKTLVRAAFCAVPAYFCLEKSAGGLEWPVWGVGDVPGAGCLAEGLARLIQTVCANISGGMHIIRVGNGRG